MIRIWFKLISDEKLIKSEIYTSPAVWSVDELYIALQVICHKFDIPTPVVLSTHINNYLNFNSIFFKERDFIETFQYDSLVLENATE